MPRKLIPAIALVAGLFVAFVMATGAAAPASADPALDSEEQAFVQLINQYRAENGLGPLATAASINAAADWMSGDMGQNNYFSHNDSLNRSPWTRMCDYGYCYNTYKGENIAAGYTSAVAVFNAWKASPGHNANMLGPNYTVMGIARVYTAGSTYGYYWTNDFGGYTPPGGAVITPTPTPVVTASPTRTPSPTPSPVPVTASPTRTPSPTPSPVPVTASPTRTPSPTPVPVTPTPTPTPSPTPVATASPTPTSTPVVLQLTPSPSPSRTASPTPRPTVTPRIVRDIAVTYFTVEDNARAGTTKQIIFRITNYGTVTDSFTYKITQTCMDGNTDKVLTCPALVYSPACSGAGSLAAKQMKEVRCTVTYTGATGKDRWRHTLTATSPGDSRLNNNTRILERRVY